MLGQMQDHPLLISSLIDFASRHHHEAQIVSTELKVTCTATPTPTRPCAAAAWPMRWTG